ncbi:MAG: hypothetical protein ACK54M_04685 [Pseudanabaena sp.]
MVSFFLRGDRWLWRWIGDRWLVDFLEGRSLVMRMDRRSRFDLFFERRSLFVVVG